MRRLLFGRRGQFDNTKTFMLRWEGCSSTFHALEWQGQLCAMGDKLLGICLHRLLRKEPLDRRPRERAFPGLESSSTDCDLATEG